MIPYYILWCYQETGKKDKNGNLAKCVKNDDYKSLKEPIIGGNRIEKQK